MIIPGVGAFNGGWLYKLGNCGHSIESASIFGRDDLEIGARCLAVCARCLAVCARCSAVSAWCSAGGARCSAVRARCSAIGARCSAVGARCSEVSARIQFSMFDFCAPTWDSGYKLGSMCDFRCLRCDFKPWGCDFQGLRCDFGQERCDPHIFPTSTIFPSSLWLLHQMNDDTKISSTSYILSLPFHWCFGSDGKGRLFWFKWF